MLRVRILLNERWGMLLNDCYVRRYVALAEIAKPGVSAGLTVSFSFHPYHYKSIDSLGLRENNAQSLAHGCTATDKDNMTARPSSRCLFLRLSWIVAQLAQVCATL